MSGIILVAYATKHGSMAEIAEKIGEVLNRAGLRAETLPVDRVRDLSPYSAVILGSAVYMGRWRKRAAVFLQKHEKALAGMPVWLFSSGPTGDGEAEELLKGWRFPEKLLPAADRIQPRGIAVFSGKFDVEKASSFDAWIMRKVKAPAGDFRDWKAVESWAGVIAEDLKKSEL